MFGVPPPPPPPPEHSAIGNIHRDILFWGIITLQHVIQTIPGAFTGVFWWYRAFYENREKSSLNPPKLSCDFNTPVFTVWHCLIAYVPYSWSWKRSFNIVEVRFKNVLNIDVCVVKCCSDGPINSKEYIVLKCMRSLYQDIYDWISPFVNLMVYSNTEIYGENEYCKSGHLSFLFFYTSLKYLMMLWYGVNKARGGGGGRFQRHDSM